MRLVICTLALSATSFAAPINVTQEENSIVESFESLSPEGKQLFIYALVASVITPNPIANPDLYHCEDGWIRIENSCYWYGKNKLSFKDVRFDCEYNRQAKPFVPDTPEEHEAVFKAGPRDTHVWIGPLTELTRYVNVNEVRYPVAVSYPIGYLGPHDVSYKDLDWLSKPFNHELNGFSQFSTCAAHYTSSVAKFTYYYNCDLPFNYICERSIIPDLFSEHMK